MHWHKETSCSTIIALLSSNIDECLLFLKRSNRECSKEINSLTNRARCLLIRFENGVLVNDFFVTFWQSLGRSYTCLVPCLCLCVFERESEWVSARVSMHMHVHIGILCRIGSRVIQAFILGVFETLSYLEIPELKWFHAALHQIWQWSMKLSHSV